MKDIVIRAVKKYFEPLIWFSRTVAGQLILGFIAGMSVVILVVALVEMKGG